MSSHKSARQIHEALGHPVVDGDGHSIEYVPALRDYLHDEGGQKLVDAVDTWIEKRAFSYADLSAQERREKRAPRPVFWGIPTKNVKDRVSAIAPNLLRSRLDEIGIDVSLVYPTIGGIGAGEEDVRRGYARGLNRLNADLFAAHKDRLIPVAVIPATTPEEAIAELRYAVEKLGFKAASLALPFRENAKVKEKAPELARHARWFDTLALDSEYDYDPLWQTFVDLKVAVTTHTGSSNFGLRQSWSNHVYNHIGHFAQAGEAFAKALVLGGVTHRFPTLNFAFLEGGVGWGAILYHDLLGHYDKRSRASLERNNPAHLDVKAQAALIRQWGGKLIEGRENSVELGHVATVWEREQKGATLDEFEQSGARSAEDLARPFRDNFYFGAEADDPTTAFAFFPQHRYGTEFKAILGSDIGHWDVADYLEVLPEAYELVENGSLTRAQFKKFAFENSVTLHGRQNPDFFRGTVVEQAAAEVLGATSLVGA